MDITRLLNQSAVLKRRSGSDLYGDPVFSTGVTVKMRWEAMPKLVINANAESVPSNARVWTTETVSVGDVFAYGGADHPVIAVTSVPDFAGRATFTEAAVS